MHTLHTIGSAVLSILSARKPKPRIVRECAEAASRVPPGISTSVRDSDCFWYSVTKLADPTTTPSNTEENKT